MHLSIMIAAFVAAVGAIPAAQLVDYDPRIQSVAEASDSKTIVTETHLPHSYKTRDLEKRTLKISKKYPHKKHRNNKKYWPWPYYSSCDDIDRSTATAFPQSSQSREPESSSSNAPISSLTSGSPSFIVSSSIVISLSNVDGSSPTIISPDVSSSKVASSSIVQSSSKTPVATSYPSVVLSSSTIQSSLKILAPTSSSLVVSSLLTIRSSLVVLSSSTIQSSSNVPDPSSSVLSSSSQARSSSSTFNAGSSSSSSIASAASSIADPNYPNGIVYANTVVNNHNFHRANHSAPNISWDPSLAITAKEIADTCIYGHDTTVNGGGYGQNIAAGAPISAISRVITDQFYNSEAPSFTHYGEPTPSDFEQNFNSYGHFTQLVWVGSIRVGCASTDCSTRGGLQNVGPTIPSVFHVCNYGPAGNYLGQFDQNVLPPIGLPTVRG